ncbi:MAG TPA: GtrA family protein [Burkholderiaceae bacterium]|jgi:putative flippase GtrA|nr:GtrA family protein [Burkholderiaceae bacterium]
MSISRQFIRFAAVGACGTAVQYGVLQVGTASFGIPAAVASGIGYACGSIVNYLLNYFFTFESDKSHAEAATKYFSLLGVGFCINTGLMAILVHQLGWNKWLAQFLTTGIGLVYNFAGSRLWAFKEARH